MPRPPAADIEMPVHLAGGLPHAGGGRSPSLLGTRCAGPLQSDIASQLARRVVDVASLFHGRTAVDLASSADFAVHGLAGTVTSTVQLRLGRPRTHRFSDRRLLVQAAEIPHRRARSTPLRLTAASLIHIHGDPSSCTLRSARAAPTARLPCKCTALPERWRSARSRARGARFATSLTRWGCARTGIRAGSSYSASSSCTDHSRTRWMSRRVLTRAGTRVLPAPTR